MSSPAVQNLTHQERADDAPLNLEGFPETDFSLIEGWMMGHRVVVIAQRRSVAAGHSSNARAGL